MYKYIFIGLLLFAIGISNDALFGKHRDLFQLNNIATIASFLETVDECCFNSLRRKQSFIWNHRLNNDTIACAEVDRIAIVKVR